MKREQTPRPVHANIQRLRIARGLTQAELGSRVGRDKTVVSHWETGKSAPALEVLPAVAAALETTTDELLAEFPPKKSHQKSRSAASKAS